MTPNWRVYYDTGETFSDLDGNWAAAPQHGVVCVVVRDPTGQWGRWVLSGKDFYVKYPEGEQLFATDDLAPFFDRVGGERWEWVKYGRNQLQDDWERIMRAAVKDPDFPRKAPRRRAEDFL